MARGRKNVNAREEWDDEVVVKITLKEYVDEKVDSKFLKFAVGFWILVATTLLSVLVRIFFLPNPLSS